MIVPRIVTDDEGVWRVSEGGTRSGIAWSEISRVTAGKIDSVESVHTLVALDFEFGEFVELNSSFDGFVEAIPVIARRLGGFPANWRTQVDELGPEDGSLVLWERPPPS